MGEFDIGNGEIFLNSKVEIVHKGDESGNSMAVRFRLPSGLEERINELLQHHLQRCAAMLEILHDKPKSAETIAEKHFEERLLKGYGCIMAKKKGRLGKLKLTGKLFIDVFRTGQTDLLKS